MGYTLKHEYRLKFYLNAQHYFVDSKTGVKGEVHPHTWEFCLSIAVSQQNFIPFHLFEKGVNAYLEPYQNRVMNECPPFDVVLPTLESMTDRFARDLYEIVDQQGGRLLRVEGSEGPTRSYIVTIERAETSHEHQAREQAALSNVIDNVLDDILK